ncbi:MAG TPA: M14 family zinc carboxypeptidase [Ignavibacteriaceae bacterium]|nr:M14 family zinc carboxypeptidase [Ignavibacteriaceae bacterium]
MIIVIIIILIINRIDMAQDIDFANRLYYDYENFKEKTINQRRFKHSDLLPIIGRLKNNTLFKVKKAGESAEGRDIFLISAGSGDQKIFLWSQMHGDEPTATMAMFDIFNFFCDESRFSEFKKKLLENATVYFMPMINPDGAEIYQRRNSFNIDLNRDAVRQQMPEARILRETFDSLKAEFGFNLHDQSTRYSAGNTFKSATLSFLAPAIDGNKTIDTVREKAMKLTAELYKILSSFIPGHIAKYSDDFEPRAFGDNFQRWGTSTILIESGGWKDDPEKQFIRKLNFIALLCAFKSISEKNYSGESIETYESIPNNEEWLMDLLIRNLTFKIKGREFLIDLGINREEVNVNGGKNFYYSSYVEDAGDLSVFFGYEDYDFAGMEVSLGRTYEKVFNSLSEIEKINFKELYREGFTAVQMKSANPDSGGSLPEYSALPINIILNNKPSPRENIEIEGPADFVISKEGIVKSIIINGFLYNIENSTGEIKNGLIFKQ